MSEQAIIEAVQRRKRQAKKPKSYFKKALRGVQAWWTAERARAEFESRKR